MSNDKEQPKDEPKRAPHLLSRDFKEAAYVRNIWSARPPAGTPVEALRDPAYWANIAAYLQPNARIEVMPVDGAYFAEFIVRSAGPNWAHVEMLRHHEFVSAESVVAKAKDYKVEWGGPSHKHRVVRVSDKAVMKHSFDTPEQASEWLAANVKSLAPA